MEAVSDQWMHELPLSRQSWLPGWWARFSQPDFPDPWHHLRGPHVRCSCVASVARWTQLPKFVVPRYRSDFSYSADQWVTIANACFSRGFFKRNGVIGPICPVHLGLCSGPYCCESSWLYLPADKGDLYWLWLPWSWEGYLGELSAVLPSIVCIRTCQQPLDFPALWNAWCHAAHYAVWWTCSHSTVSFETLRQSFANSLECSWPCYEHHLASWAS